MIKKSFLRQRRTVQRICGPLRGSILNRGIRALGLNYRTFIGGTWPGAWMRDHGLVLQLEAQIRRADISPKQGPWAGAQILSMRLGPRFTGPGQMPCSGFRLTLAVFYHRVVLYLFFHKRGPQTTPPPLGSGPYTLYRVHKPLDGPALQ